MTIPTTHKLSGGLLNSLCMSGYEWVCPTSVEGRVQYLLKVLMDFKFKKILKRDGPKRNVGFKKIIINYIFKVKDGQKMCSFSYGCFSSLSSLHLFTLLN